MLNPPGAMREKTQRLAAEIRQHSDTLWPVSCYAEFIRDNIASVVKNTFPLFYQLSGHSQIAQWVDEFMSAHSASAPEFHHIATEFALFAQLAPSLPANWRALVEYEFAVFSVEIDTQTVPKTSEWQVAFEAQQQDYCLHLNPTLILVEVPFLVHPASVTFLTGGGEKIAYALFRTTGHRVISQRLREADIAIIQLIQQQPQHLARTERQIQQHLAGFDFMKWVRHFSEKGLIIIQPSTVLPSTVLPSGEIL